MCYLVCIIKINVKSCGVKDVMWRQKSIEMHESKVKLTKKRSCHLATT